MQQFEFQPLLHLKAVHLASIVDLDADLGSTTIPSSLKNLQSIVCPIDIDADASSWGSTDQMQWQHHNIHIGYGNQKQQLVAKTNWAWQSKKYITQAGLEDTARRITAHKFVKEQLSKFLAYLEATVLENPNITLKILLEEVSTLRVSSSLTFFLCLAW